jgi:ribosomal protein L19
MAGVTADAQLRMRVKMAQFRPPMPRFHVGDAIELRYAQELGEADAAPVRGTVMARANKGLDDKFTIINAVDDEW